MLNVTTVMMYVMVAIFSFKHDFKSIRYDTCQFDVF